MTHGVAAKPSCGGAPMTVKVGQALAVLVKLSDGRKILVDTGEQPNRPGCGGPCRQWSEHLLEGLRNDLPDKKLDLVLITHQHSDHVGNAVAVLHEFVVAKYVDNGTSLDERVVKDAHDAAPERGIRVIVIDPSHKDVPMANSAEVKLTAIVPDRWPKKCETDPNDCSIGLRIDYCESSILFTGDAERGEEAVLDAGGDVDLLQVGHHGSDTSSTEHFVANMHPKYAVISAARK